MDREFDVNYEEMSDFEINKAVSAHVDFGDFIVSNNESEVYFLESDGLFSVVPVAHFNPCDNPSDAWPIILENKISTSWAFDDTWVAKCTNQGEPGEFKRFVAEDKNPLRAAMICFLKKMEK